MNGRTYQIDFSWNEDIMEIAITGRSSKQNSREIAQDVFNVLHEHKPDKVLIDCIKVTGRLNLIDTYFHVRQFPTRRHRPAKVAVVDIPENESFFSFHETTAANAGTPLKYFTDFEEAVKWLRQ